MLALVCLFVCYTPPRVSFEARAQSRQPKGKQMPRLEKFSLKRAVINISYIYNRLSSQNLWGGEAAHFLEAGTKSWESKLPILCFAFKISSAAAGAIFFCHTRTGRRVLWPIKAPAHFSFGSWWISALACPPSADCIWRRALAFISPVSSRN